MSARVEVAVIIMELLGIPENPVEQQVLNSKANLKQSFPHLAEGKVMERTAEVAVAKARMAEKAVVAEIGIPMVLRMSAEKKDLTAQNIFWEMILWISPEEAAEEEDQQDSLVLAMVVILTEVKAAMSIITAALKSTMHQFPERLPVAEVAEVVLVQKATIVPPTAARGVYISDSIFKEK